MTFDEYRQQVMALVHSALEKESWFRGVNATGILDSWKRNEPVERAAELAEMETEFWDGGLV